MSDCNLEPDGAGFGSCSQAGGIAGNPISWTGLVELASQESVSLVISGELELVDSNATVICNQQVDVIIDAGNGVLETYSETGPYITACYTVKPLPITLIRGEPRYMVEYVSDTPLASPTPTATPTQIFESDDWPDTIITPDDKSDRGEKPVQSGEQPEPRDKRSESEEKP